MLPIFNNLFHKKNDLEKALYACKQANEQGYKEAKTHLKELEKSIDKASFIISECIDGMKKHRINDEDLILKIKSQLQIVQTEFKQSYFETENNLSNKRKMSSKFNITLFGRTKAGKSTLMEILTHGDGSRMGKGGQRTTRDVRSYDWKGMSITDVPGIESYGGMEDDKKAEESAIYADLILFMITAGQPESAEADWLVKLKKMDKPILCICNYKQSLGESIDDYRFKRFLNNPKILEERMNVGELINQFNIFLREQLPNEHVDFLVSHLLSKFYSQQPEYESKKEELEKISRFSKIENAIINEVNTNGVLHRKKCYLSIIDAPLYRQMNQLYTFSSNAYSQYRIIQDKINDFEEWCKVFNTRQKKYLEDSIKKEFNQLRNSVPGFVETHLKDGDLNASWEEHQQKFNIPGNIKKAISIVKNKLQHKISDLFREIDNEMKFSFKLKMNNDLGNYKFTNWKRAMQWAGTIGSAGSVIALAILGASNPIGWAVGAVGVLFSVFSIFFDSREHKLRERRVKLTNKLNEEISKAESESINKILSWFDKEFIKKENEVTKRIKILGKSLLSLSCGERQLALGNSKIHKDITKMILANIFYSLGIPMNELDRVICVARVPGKRIAIVINGTDNLPLRISDIESKLGNKERIKIIKLNTSKSIGAQIFYLLQSFKIEVQPKIIDVYDGKQTIVYLPNENYSQNQMDSIDLIQQIMNVHIIIR